MRSVLHLISGGDAGGAKTHLFALMQGLKDHVHAKIICFIRDTFYLEARDLGIDIEAIEQKSRFDMAVMKKVSQEAKAMGAEILHCHGARANFNALFYKGDQLKVTTIHSDYKLDFKGNFLKQMIFTPLNSLALKQFDYYIAVTENFKDMLVERGFPKDRIFVVYNGINLEAQEDKLSREEFFSKYKIEDKPYFNFGIVARLDAIKDHKTLLKAFAQAGLKDRARLFIAGDGPEWEDLHSLAQSLNILDQVYFLGEMKDPYSLYQVLDVNLLTSQSESFPYALLEGAKERLPGLASRVGGIPEMIRPNKEGLLFRAGDVKDLSEAMVYCVDHPEEMRTMGDNFYKRVKEKFSIQSMAQDHEKIYEEMIRRGK